MSNYEVTASNIAEYISSGDMDEYLRGLYNAVVARKKFLDGNKSLPEQRDIPPLATGFAPTLSNTPPLATAPTTVATQKPSKRGLKFQPHSVRPDPNEPVWHGRVSPLTIDQVDSKPATSVVYLGGLAYDKSEIIGKIIQAGPTITGSGSVDLRLKVIGIGPKACKVLIVNEPNRGDQFQGNNLHALWELNQPLFVPHTVITAHITRP